MLAQLIRPPDEAQRGVQDRDPMTESLRLLEAVRRKKDGHPVLAECAEEIVNVTCRDRVEPGGGLVKKQDLRVAEERSRQRDASAKAFRQRTAEVVRAISEVDCLQRPVDAVPRIAELIETSEAFEVLRDGEPEVEAGDSGMIEMRRPYRRSRLGAQGNPRDRCRARRRRDEGTERPHSRRLPGAVWT